MELLLLLLSFIVTTIIIFLCHYYHSSSRRHGNLPPGSVGMPLVGETLRLIAAYKSSNPEPFIDDRVRLHGRIFTTHVFGERTVFSADPDLNRAVLNGEGRSFECSYPSSIATLLGSNSLLIMKAPLHKRMHSLTVARFASLSLLKSSLLSDTDRLVRLTLGSWTHSQTLSLLDQTKKITFELTVKQLMSREPGEWTEALRKEYVMLIDGFFSIPLRFFTTYGRAIKARTKVVRACHQGADEGGGDAEGSD